MRDGEYCGLACGELLEDFQKILDQCITHAKYDPVFAPIMVQKLIDQAQKVKYELEEDTNRKERFEWAINP